MKRTLIFIVGVCLLALSFLNAADGTWDTTTAAVTENWSDTAFWSGGTVASGVNATATFEYFSAGGSGSAFDSIISLDSAFTLGSIVANGSGSGNTHNITIVGPGVLTLETGTATPPTITNNLSHGRSVTINPVIDGTEGLDLTTDLSSGPIVLGGANTYTGLTQINNNIVSVNHNQAFGSTTGATSVTSSLAAIMLNNGITVTGETLNLTGIGTGNYLGAIHTANNAVATWTGDIHLDDSSVRVGAQGAVSVLTLSGAIGDGGAGYNLAFSHGNDANEQGTVVLSGVNSYGGSTTIYRGTVKLDGGNDRLPTTTLVSLGGTSTDSTLDLNGQNQQINGLNNHTNGTSSRTVTNASGTASVFTINNSGDQSFIGDAGDITSITGNLSLVKSGSFTQTLAKTNDFTGDTTVNGGTITLADDASWKFYIGSNGVNNGISGSGTLALNGDFIFDLAGAGNTVGDSWSIVNVSTLNETFGGTFTVQGFSESAGIWSNEVYEFDESIGTLTVIPEPSSLVLVGLFAGLFVVSLKRTKR